MSDDDERPVSDEVVASDDDERRRLGSIRARLRQLEPLYERFGKENVAMSIRELHRQMATIPEHILLEEKINEKLAEFSDTIQAYITKRRAKNLPPVADIWQAVKGFEQQHDSQDLGNSSLLKTILREARQLNISEKTLEMTAREAAASA